MRKLFNPIAGVFLLGLFLGGCGNDDGTEGLAGDENLNKKNHFKVGNTEYELSDGSLENYGEDVYGEWHEGYNLDLLLVSKNLKITQREDGGMDVTGSGNAIYFEFFTSEGSSLDNGDYEHGAADFFPVGTYDYASYYIDVDTGEEEDNDVRISTGKITVKRDGQEYELTIDCKDEDGKAVTGYYKGTLQYFDYTSGSASSRILFHPKKRR
jgi:hypothetical protein